jgi:hypothetical protein
VRTPNMASCSWSSGLRGMRGSDGSGCLAIGIDQLGGNGECEPTGLRWSGCFDDDD